MFKSLITRLAQKQIQSAFNAGVKSERTRREASSLETKWFEMDALTAGPVICVSNEHDNIVVGFIERIESICLSNEPLAIVKDYVSGKTLAIMGSIFGYTEDRFNALADMSPSQRVTVIYHSAYSREDKVFNNLTTAEEDILTREEVIIKLRENGFYDWWKELKNKNTDNNDTLSA